MIAGVLSAPGASALRVTGPSTGTSSPGVQRGAARRAWRGMTRCSAVGDDKPGVAPKATKAAPRKRASAKAAAKGDVAGAEEDAAPEAAAAAVTAKATATKTRSAAKAAEVTSIDFPRPERPPWWEMDGTGICARDGALNDHRGHLQYRYDLYKKWRGALDEFEGGLDEFSLSYRRYGLNVQEDNSIVYREWAPGAAQVRLFGDFNNWDRASHTCTKSNEGVHTLVIPPNADGTPAIKHGSKVKAHVETAGGMWVDRIPAYIRYAVQEQGSIQYDGVFWNPPKAETYVAKHPRPKKPSNGLRIYETHVGMAGVEPRVHTYLEFKDDILPRIKKLGYNAIQIMAIMEHAYYGSFGYHVTNFFGVSSRQGTPEDLKAMIDEAHRLGIVVLCDVVHSHASKNIEDGINMWDGTDGGYFHSGARGNHWMWDSRLFNYGNWETVRFLLSNLRYWMEEYKFDGFRFDGVTSMLYHHHGLAYAFTGNYGEYFGQNTDVEACTYLMLANEMIHSIYAEAITIGEDVSGMPGLARPVDEGGLGFDYRLAMAAPDMWIELMKTSDWDWKMGHIVHTLTDRRWGEGAVCYAESHDQALVGDKTLAFHLMDKEMYDWMSTLTPSTPIIDRGIALHKLIRLVTMALGGEGYLNFMGNEFGHPEWIDFPREGNGWSYHQCRRRFDLADADHLRYKYMQNFDIKMQQLANDYDFVGAEHQYVSRKDEGDKMIVFERGPLVFVFNFHPTNSYMDYKIGCHLEGKFTLVLDSDTADCGGFSLVNGGKLGGEHFTSAGDHDGRPHSFMVYSPSRTCQVYALADASGKPIPGGWP